MLRSHGLLPLCSMVPHKTKRGAAALERLKCFDGVPAPYDRVKRMVVPEALQSLRLQTGHRFCKLGDLASAVSTHSLQAAVSLHLSCMIATSSRAACSLQTTHPPHTGRLEPCCHPQGAGGQAQGQEPGILHSQEARDCSACQGCRTGGRYPAPASSCACSRRLADSAHLSAQVEAGKA